VTDNGDCEIASTTCPGKKTAEDAVLDVLKKCDTEDLKKCRGDCQKAADAVAKFVVKDKSLDKLTPCLVAAAQQVTTEFVLAKVAFLNEFVNKKGLNAVLESCDGAGKKVAGVVDKVVNAAATVQGTAMMVTGTTLVAWALALVVQ